MLVTSNNVIHIIYVQFKCNKINYVQFLKSYLHFLTSKKTKQKLFNADNNSL